MKNYKPELLLLLFVILGSTNPIYSQSKIEMSAGVGMPEFLNARIKYGKNLQIGACAGFITGSFYGNSYFDWSGAAEVTYHFSGKSKFIEQPPWYVLGGLGYYYLPMSNDFGKYSTGFYPRLGRTINFSKSSGANLDIGLFLPLSPSPDYQTIQFQVLWTWSFSFFIRL